MALNTVKGLEEFGRTRLSPNFFMRDFLYSEIAQVEFLLNIPIDENLAIRAGKGLCENVLEPMQESLGKISIRSGYRSSEVNRRGNEKKHNCANNENNRARHIWDEVDKNGHFGATACIVVNSFLDYYERTGDWTVLAWWLHDHISCYRDIVFFHKLAAFNINWYSGDVIEQKISSQVPNPHTGKKGILTKTGMYNFCGSHVRLYEEWLQ